MRAFPPSWKPHWPLLIVLCLYTVMALIGIRWGLPTSRIDRFLFPDGQVWSGKKMLELAGGKGFDDPRRGADVDVDPLAKSDDPIRLNATEADAAAIYIRYRLYSHQPDEMITFRALAGMNPRQLKLDPRLYQYGGLFIYPVGALIAVCGKLGLIHVTSDLAYYLDHPDEFGKFYVVARAYVALWGFLGVILVYAIAHRLQGRWAGAMAALLFTLLPVVVCMSHEAKPHLPGAVLMLVAVWCAMNALDAADAKDRRKWFWCTCIACGAAQGMVLSSLPIFILIPMLVSWSNFKSPETPGSRARSVISDLALGLIAAVTVYFVTNPYVLVHLIGDREVLRSNLSNSTAMYGLSMSSAGFKNALGLLYEAATLPVVWVGLVGFLRVNQWADRRAWALVGPASILGVQFWLLAEGKPPEYARFTLFLCAALAVSAICFLVRRFLIGRAIKYTWAIIIVAITIFTGIFGWATLTGFQVDNGPHNSRQLAAEQILKLLETQPAVSVGVEPAPYSCPPMDFANVPLWLATANGNFDPAIHGIYVEVLNYEFLVSVIPSNAPKASEAYFLDSVGGLRGRDHILAEADRISWADREFNVTFWIDKDSQQGRERREIESKLLEK